jgi:hypothetical protein
MRHIVAKQVRKLFQTLMSNDGWCKIDQRINPPGSIGFRKKWAVGNMFVSLLFDPLFDRFTLECAWSEDETFPVEGFPKNPVAFPNHGVSADPFEGRNYRFRLVSLWEPRLDPWWEVESDGMEFNSGRPAVFLGGAEQTVTRAVEEFLERGIPFLKNVLNETK